MVFVTETSRCDVVLLNLYEDKCGGDRISCVMEIVVFKQIAANRLKKGSMLLSGC